MGKILEYLQQRWNSAGYSELFGYFATIIVALGLISFLWNLGLKLHKRLQRRKLERELFPFYTPQDIQQATQYYIETTCQSRAPSKVGEPRQSHAVGPKERVLAFFLKKAFKPEKDECQFYIVLAEPGMGKTTCLINLYLRYIKQFWGTKYNIKLFPLGFSEIDKEIGKIPHKIKRQTILLLDAFDEDIKAVHNSKTRLNELIQQVLYFRKVVITCRTQFFPRQEKATETGVLQLEGRAGKQGFRTLYLSPFDDKDVRSYLHKRFAWFQLRKKHKAQQIVEFSSNLPMARSILLNYVDALLHSEPRYSAAYLVYAEIVRKWVEREAKNVPTKQREHYEEELSTFSHEIARNIYANREQRQGALSIPGEAINLFAEKHGISPEELEMKSWSLLNRNAQKQYKFSHKSVLEYFLAKEALLTPDFRERLDFDDMAQAEAFFDDMIWEQLTIPFFGRADLNGEYRLKGERPKSLKKMDAKLLSQINSIKFREWKQDDDLVLFKGLKNLARLDFGTLSAAQENELQHFLPNCKIRVIFCLPLRNRPLKISCDAFKEVFGLDDEQRPLEYFQSRYVDQDEVVVDHAAGLMWQKSGSHTSLLYDNAQEYVEGLNKKRFAGYDDWRLPMIPELMSLLESEKHSHDVYISPLFDATQLWCWSADKRLGTSGLTDAAWYVDFGSGDVYWNLIRSSSYVRCVRCPVLS